MFWKLVTFHMHFKQKQSVVVAYWSHLPLLLLLRRAFLIAELGLLATATRASGFSTSFGKRRSAPVSVIRGRHYGEAVALH